MGRALEPQPPPWPPPGPLAGQECPRLPAEAQDGTWCPAGAQESELNKRRSVVALPGGLSQLTALFCLPG